MKVDGKFYKVQKNYLRAGKWIFQSKNFKKHRRLPLWVAHEWKIFIILLVAEKSIPRRAQWQWEINSFFFSCSSHNDTLCDTTRAKLRLLFMPIFIFISTKYFSTSLVHIFYAFWWWQWWSISACISHFFVLSSFFHLINSTSSSIFLALCKLEDFLCALSHSRRKKK